MFFKKIWRNIIKKKLKEVEINASFKGVYLTVELSFKGDVFLKRKIYLGSAKRAKGINITRAKNGKNIILEVDNNN